mgnify:CR=1 FL=1|jgi:hypothetical protein
MAALEMIASEGLLVEEWLCKAQPSWQGEDAAYFARCAAGVGVSVVEAKLKTVDSWSRVQGGAAGVCSFRTDGSWSVGALSDWERMQFSLTTVLQRTCDLEEAFAVANEECPAAMMAHFPCLKERPDYRFCEQGWHRECAELETLRCDGALAHFSHQLYLPIHNYLVVCCAAVEPHTVLV